MHQDCRVDARDPQLNFLWIRKHPAVIEQVQKKQAENDESGAEIVSRNKIVS